MVVIVRLHGANHTKVISAGADVGEEFGDLKAALAVLGELEWGPDEETLLRADGLAVVEGELGFGIEGIDLGDAAGHVHEDDALGLGGEMRGLRRHGIVRGESVGDHAGHEQRTGEKGADGITPVRDLGLLHWVSPIVLRRQPGATG